MVEEGSEVILPAPSALDRAITRYLEETPETVPSIATGEAISETKPTAIPQIAKAKEISSKSDEELEKGTADCEIQKEDNTAERLVGQRIPALEEARRAREECAVQDTSTGGIQQETQQSYLESIADLMQKFDPKLVKVRQKAARKENLLEWDMSVPDMNDIELEEAIIAAHAQAHAVEGDAEEFQPEVDAQDTEVNNQQIHDETLAAYQALSPADQLALWEDYYTAQGEVQDLSISQWPQEWQNATDALNNVPEINPNPDYVSLQSPEELHETSTCQENRQTCSAADTYFCFERSSSPLTIGGRLPKQGQPALRSEPSSEGTTKDQKQRSSSHMQFWNPGEAEIDAEGFVRVPVSLLKRYYKLEAMYWDAIDKDVKSIC